MQPGNPGERICVGGGSYKSGRIVFAVLCFPVISLLWTGCTRIFRHGTVHNTAGVQLVADPHVLLGGGIGRIAEQFHIVLAKHTHFLCKTLSWVCLLDVCVAFKNPLRLFIMSKAESVSHPSMTGRERIDRSVSQSRFEEGWAPHDISSSSRGADVGSAHCEHQFLQCRRGQYSRDIF